MILKFPAVLKLGGTASQWFLQREERNFDRRLGINTSGTHWPSDLPPKLRSKFYEYTPSPPAHFSCLLSSLLLNLNDYIFVDIGSGKGKLLCVAAEFPFQRIIGIELSQGLHETATKNIAAYRSRTQKCSDIQSLCQDAGGYQFEDAKLILYFYNPFSEIVLFQVLENLKLSISKCPRDIVIIYYNPIHKYIFDQCDILSPSIPPGWNDPMWMIYRTHGIHTQSQG